MKRILTAAIMVAMATAGVKAETPRWVRNTAISPDGKSVAFTYKGDIFVVPVSGGEARQITSGSGYDSYPVWSPDGQTIVFSSDRNGAESIFRTSVKGGNPVRLTTNSSSAMPLAFLNDSTLLYSSNVMIDRESAKGPFYSQVYALNISEPGARPRTWMPVSTSSLSLAPDGRLLYQDKKGFENVWRKHERSSGTSDIWLRDKDEFRKLTSFNGHDLNPVWKADGKGFWYVSEENGTLNVYESDMEGNHRALTSFEKHPVRSLSAAGDGTLSFSWDGDLYVLPAGGAPRKVDIEINADQYDSDIVKDYRNSGASSMAVSPDGKEVAFVLRGDVYVTDTKYKTTRRITDTPAQERCVSFSPDGRKLVYDSDREGYWQLFIAAPADTSQKRFAYAGEIVETPLYKCSTAAQQPVFSPDGKKVAFLEDRTALRVIDVDSRKVTTALPEDFNYSYSDGDVQFEWSPDSEWLLVNYIGIGGWNNTDIALVKADGSKVVDLTESGYSDGNPNWAIDGKAFTYETGKYGMKSHGSWGNQTDVVLMALDGEAWDKFTASEEETALREEAEKAEKEKAESKKGKDKKGSKGKDKADKKNAADLDLENRKYRTAVLTPASVLMGDYWLNPKGDKFYYVAASPEGKAKLMMRDLRKGDTKVLMSDVEGQILSDAKGENVFMLTSGGIRKLDLANGSMENVEFEAPYDRHPSKEREYIYDHMLRQVKDKFYDADLHGVDWDYYGEHYREFLPYISNNNDFAILLSEILGELNASHTGGGFRKNGASLRTANLGAFFDEGYNGDGLCVAEVLPQSPLAARKAAIKPGDIIETIDGEPIKAGKDYFPLLEGKDGKKTRLGVLKADGSHVSVEIKPWNAWQLNNALYRRWVEKNQAYVDSISGGKIAYVHVRGMDSPSFRTVYDELLGKYRNREAVVVDTRANGGGWLHNDIALLLSGKEYVRFAPRRRYIGSEPFSQWTKPSVMLVDESNYSDAHGTPYTYKTLGLGKIVGAPVPGTMTAVWWETQIDPSLYFGIPQVTSLDRNGKALENQQLNPDIEVYNNPGDELRGHDAQLERAVRELMKK